MGKIDYNQALQDVLDVLEEELHVLDKLYSDSTLTPDQVTQLENHIVLQQCRIVAVSRLEKDMSHERN